MSRSPRWRARVSSPKSSRRPCSTAGSIWSSTRSRISRPRNPRGSRSWPSRSAPTRPICCSPAKVCHRPHPGQPHGASGWRGPRHLVAAPCGPDPRAVSRSIEVKALRGNVPTRIGKLRDGGYDAILLAAAGVGRLELDLTGLDVAELRPEVMLPAPGQGALAIETREARRTHPTPETTPRLRGRGPRQRGTPPPRTPRRRLPPPPGLSRRTAAGGIRLQAVLGRIDEEVTHATVARVGAVSPKSTLAADACFEALRLAGGCRPIPNEPLRSHHPPPLRLHRAPGEAHALRHHPAPLPRAASRGCGERFRLGRGGRDRPPRRSTHMAGHGLAPGARTLRRTVPEARLRVAARQSPSRSSATARPPHHRRPASSRTSSDRVPASAWPRR